GNDFDLEQARVDEVGEHEIDQPVAPGHRHRGLGAFSGQRPQPPPLAPCEDDRQYPRYRTTHAGIIPGYRLRAIVRREGSGSERVACGLQPVAFSQWCRPARSRNTAPAPIVTSATTAIRSRVGKGRCGALPVLVVPSSSFSSDSTPDGGVLVLRR